LPIARLRELGYDIWATEGTAEVLSRYGVSARVVAKHTDVRGDDEASIVDLIADGQVDIIINTPRGRSARADGYEIRTATVAADKALFTTIGQLGAAVVSLEERPEVPHVKSLQAYQADRDAQLSG